MASIWVGNTLGNLSLHRLASSRLCASGFGSGRFLNRPHHQVLSCLSSLVAFQNLHDFFVAHLSKLVEFLVVKISDLDARFQEELRIKDYEFSGDAYDDQRYQELRQKWSVKPKPEGDQYLRLIKKASEDHWAHLRLLADFMEIGRIPRSWEKDLLPEDRQQRWGRTNIRIIDYSKEGVVRNDSQVL